MFIWDGHDGSRTLSIDEIEPAAKPIQGKPTPANYYWPTAPDEIRRVDVDLPAPQAEQGPTILRVGGHLPQSNGTRRNAGERLDRNALLRRTPDHPA